MHIFQQKFIIVLCENILDLADMSVANANQVSYSLLIFFCGMFITVDGFNKTGIPSALWDLMEPYARIDSAGGVAVLASVILLLSNVASNVPTGKFSVLSHWVVEVYMIVRRFNLKLYVRFQ